MSPSPMHAMALILLLLFSSSTTKGFHSSYSSKSIKNLLLQAEQEADRSPQPTQQSTISPFGFIFVRNLKSAGQNPSRDAKLVQSWKEMNGLSEKSFVLNPAQLVGPDGRAQALDLAYRRCEDVTQLFSKTFYVGSSFIPSEARKHVWAIYAWCRRTDDLVDSPRTLLARDTLQTDLRHWEQRLEAIWRDEPLDLFDLAMADTVKAYPGMRIQPFKDMIAGMLMDVPGLGQDRYETFDDLYLYCYRVAGTVGLMTLPILGQNLQGRSEQDKAAYLEAAAPPAIALGIGLQLTNILRDVGEDLERGRIYLPQDELRAFGLSERDISSCVVSERYKQLMRFQIQRARNYYQQAEVGVRMLAPGSRFAVQASLDLYSGILDVIERNGYDNFRMRAFTTKFDKLTMLPKAFLKSQLPRRYPT